MATRKCAQLFEFIRQVDGKVPSEEHFPVLAKALLVHGAAWREADVYLQGFFGKPGKQHIKWKRTAVSPLIGYGRAEEEDFLLSSDYKATILGWGDINVDETKEFRLPLPACLKGQKGKRRFSGTLAWFSPINPRDRRYRRARLALSLPDKPDDVLGTKRQDANFSQVKRGTVQHEVYEGQTARGFVEDFYPIRVNCTADAGNLSESVRFGLVVSIEGAQGVFTSILDEVREGLRTQVEIRA